MITDFFFQAEDGIRDYKVTGVQTCALPIYTQRGAQRAHVLSPEHDAGARRDVDEVEVHSGVGDLAGQVGQHRSEERRVGKECRSKMTQEQLNKINYRKWH